MGILLASDHLNGSDIADAPDQLKGDLFALAGATFYGLSNVGSEFLVSKAPIYEVVGQLAFWAMPIMGVICAIFDRADFQTATWDSAVAGYLTGYTLILSLFYTLAPLLFRLASAAFFNISLLTANFWGVIIGSSFAPRARRTGTNPPAPRHPSLPPHRPLDVPHRLCAHPRRAGHLLPHRGRPGRGPQALARRRPGRRRQRPRHRQAQGRAAPRRPGRERRVSPA